MAYQNVGTPRFFIDSTSFFKLVGYNYETGYLNKVGITPSYRWELYKDENELD